MSWKEKAPREGVLKATGFCPSGKDASRMGWEPGQSRAQQGCLGLGGAGGSGEGSGFVWEVEPVFDFSGVRLVPRPDDASGAVEGVLVPSPVDDPEQKCRRLTCGLGVFWAPQSCPLAGG